MRRLNRGDAERLVPLVTDGFVVAYPPEADLVLAITPDAGRVLSEAHETPWSVAATFKLRDEEAHATVHLAKVIL